MYGVSFGESMEGLQVPKVHPNPILKLGRLNEDVLAQSAPPGWPPQASRPPQPVMARPPPPPPQPAVPTEDDRSVFPKRSIRRMVELVAGPEVGPVFSQIALSMSSTDSILLGKRCVWRSGGLVWQYSGGSRANLASGYLSFAFCWGLRKFQGRSGDVYLKICA